MSNPGAVDIGHHRRETTTQTELHRKVQQGCGTTRRRPLVDDLRNLAERVPRAKVCHDAVPVLAVCATQACGPTPDWRRRRRRQLWRLLGVIVLVDSKPSLMWDTRLSVEVVDAIAGVCIEINRWCRWPSSWVVVGSWELMWKRKRLLLLHVVKVVVRM